MWWVALAHMGNTWRCAWTCVLVEQKQQQHMAVDRLLHALGNQDLCMQQSGRLTSRSPYLPQQGSGKLKR